MEFNEKLQQLRKQNNLTQEQLAEQLYVSRSAISKWESGKGYPNIESLKCIAKLFSVSIDELLSGEELISLAETENRSNLKKIYSFISGILDIIAIAFIVLPLYGKSDGSYIHSVNLLSFTETTWVMLIIYWTIFITMIGLGFATVLFVHFEKESSYNLTKKSSVVLGVLAICFFAAAKEPYVTTLLFLLFVMKIYVLMKQGQKK
ncbi:helix-turn-helix domain-containing protein [Rummeliibacillus stabekisii]|uniref:helix-turn-helix domain-containing protein n=1 Tax=Rummeliibacillus stabekisii TaxID=241244 RepID=UPI00203A95DF|nr:helix-turn-helix transcriptional regulator [Rummeliibacillus stabekisii]MCM3317916.1 helix-turn-helix domain-containing protein [Rummeliibacillus stabekisii]